MLVVYLEMLSRFWTLKPTTVLVLKRECLPIHVIDDFLPGLELD